MNDTVSKLFWFGVSVASFCFFIAIWKAVVAFGLVSPLFLPDPVRVFDALVSGFGSGKLSSQWLATTMRMLVGWFCASLVGVLIGAMIGSSRTLRVYLRPFLEFMRPLPASAVIPLFIAIMGLTNGMVIAVIAFGTLWPMLLATIYGFSNVHDRLKEAARMLQLSSTAFTIKIAFPNALPDILAGMRFGISIALILTIVGEMVASQSGLGSMILMASRMYQTPQVFAGILLLGFTGYLSAQAIGLFERMVLRWA